MSFDDLKARLGNILAEEEESEVDWDTVLNRSAVLLSEMTFPAPDIVQDYLNSIERRRLGCVFAHAQRTDLLRFLRVA